MLTTSTLLRAAVLTLLTAPQAMAQEDDLLPFLVNVTSEDDAADHCTVVIFKDNQQEAELPPTKHNTFKLALEKGTSYTIRISKEGYHEKAVFVDTRVPENVEMRDGGYACVVTLEPADRYAQADPFYLDFPSAVVRWDEARGEFAHSESYLTDLAGKMALATASPK